MSTFAQVRSKIASDYLDRSDLTTQINTSINRAIEHYEKERFWFNETSGTFSTSSGTKAYGSGTIPSDISQIDYVEIVVNSNDYEVESRTFEYVEQIDVSHSTGIPLYYSFYQEQIYFYPIPNGTYTVRLYYQQKYTALSADGDSNDFTTEAEDLIEARACWWIYSYVLHDVERASHYKNLEMEALNSLQQKTNKLIMNIGEIRPTEF